MSEVKIRIAAGTNVGLIRQNNEDNFVVCPDLAASGWTIPQAGDTTDLGELGALLVVADGMGGANAGEVASAIAIDTIQQQFTREALQEVAGDDVLMQQFMCDTVKIADLNIVNHSQANAAARGMGTTIVMAWLYGHRAYVCWCGDSRCYAYRSIDSRLQRLSHDHSFVQELVDRGELHAELASEHPLSNVITRCLGSEEKRAEPETCVFEMNNGDTVMLCSDGLCGLCHDDQIAAIMADKHDNAVDMRDDLITAALSAGGHDNVTVALAVVEMEDVQGKDIEQIRQDGDDASEQSLENKAGENDTSQDESSSLQVAESADEQAADEDEKEGKSEKKEKDAEDEHLKDTQPCAPVRKHGRWRWLWTLLFLAAIAAAVYYAHKNHLF